MENEEMIKNLAMCISKGGYLDKTTGFEAVMDRYRDAFFTLSVADALLSLKQHDVEGWDEKAKEKMRALSDDRLELMKDLASIGGANITILRIFPLEQQIRDLSEKTELTEDDKEFLKRFEEEKAKVENMSEKDINLLYRNSCVDLACLYAFYYYTASEQEKTSEKDIASDKYDEICEHIKELDMMVARSVTIADCIDGGKLRDKCIQRDGSSMPLS